MNCPSCDKEVAASPRPSTIAGQVIYISCECPECLTKWEAEFKYSGNTNIKTDPQLEYFCKQARIMAGALKKEMQVVRGLKFEYAIYTATAKVAEGYKRVYITGDPTTNDQVS